jgi:O-antigen ligase
MHPMTESARHVAALAVSAGNPAAAGATDHAVEIVPIPPSAGARDLPPPRLTRIATPARGSTTSSDLAWLVLAAALVTALLGLLSGEMLLLGAGGAIACVVGGLIAPQVVLALLVTVGGFKAAPWLQPIPGDVTVLAAAGVIGVVGIRALRQPVPSFPPATALAILMAVIVALSVLWSPVPDEGLSKAIRFELLTLLTFVAPLVLIRTRTDFSLLMAGLLGFGMLIASTAEQTGDPLKPLTVVGGNDTNQIDLAMFCALGLLAATYLALRGGRLVRLASLASIGFLLYTLFAAGSRGILAGAILAVLYIVITLTGQVIRRRTVVVALGLAAVTVAVAIQQAPDAAARYNDLLLSGQTDAVLGQRQYLFSKGVDLAVAAPLGHGAASYPAVTGGLVYPHNIELELADEHGLLTVALLLALVVAAWRARRAAYRMGWKAESAVVGALIVVLFFDAQVSHGLNDSRPMWLAFGLALALPRLTGEPPEGTPVPSASRGRPPR